MVLTTGERHPAHAGELDQNDVVQVDAIGSNTICFHTNTAMVDSLQPLIIDRIKLAVEGIGKIIEVTDVEFRVVVFPERTRRETGTSGVAPNGEHIYVLLNPHHPKMLTSISEELVATIAHEYHHTLRHRAGLMGHHLFASIISEGLAEHFCMEVTGERTPWDSQIPPDELVPWWEKAKEIWLEPEYDYYAWFVGYGTEIPHGVGYSIGRSVVARYLERHPEELPSTLFGTRAEEFLPWAEVQAE